MVEPDCFSNGLGFEIQKPDPVKTDQNGGHLVLLDKLLHDLSKNRDIWQQRTQKRTDFVIPFVVDILVTE